MIINNLFNWYDRFRTTKFNPELSDVITKTNASDLENQLSIISKEYYQKDNVAFKIFEYKKLIDSLILLRDRALQSDKEAIKNNWMTLNPL